MEVQIQLLKKQRRRLIVACCILVLALFFVSIYAFVQVTVAVEMQKLLTKGMIRNVECEEEAKKRVACEAHSISLTVQLQEREKLLTQARAEAAVLKAQTPEKRKR